MDPMNSSRRVGRPDLLLESVAFATYIVKTILRKRDRALKHIKNEGGCGQVNAPYFSRVGFSVVFMSTHDMAGGALPHLGSTDRHPRTNPTVQGSHPSEARGRDGVDDVPLLLEPIHQCH